MAVSYDRGAGYGGDDGFKIRMGGQMRYSFPVSTSNTDVWLRGAVLRLRNDGNVELDTGHGVASGLKGLALERRSPVGGRPEQDQVMAIDKVSLLLDQAIIITPQLTSGLAYAVNDRLYPDGAGKLRNTQLGTQPVMGKALTATTGAADGSTTTIVALYSAQASMVQST